MKRGLLAVALQGTLSAAFLVWLALAGEAPSGPLVLPIPRPSYYAFEAAVVIPVRLAMAFAFAWSAHRVARSLGGRGTFAQTFDRGALALALPFVALWLLPDVVLYATSGFDALGPALRFTAPATMLATLVLAVRGLRTVHELSYGRAIVATLVGSIAQALVGAPVLR